MAFEPSVWLLPDNRLVRRFSWRAARTRLTVDSQFSVAGQCADAAKACQQRLARNHYELPVDHEDRWTTVLPLLFCANTGQPASDHLPPRTSSLAAICSAGPPLPALGMLNRTTDRLAPTIMPGGTVTGMDSPLFVPTFPEVSTGQCSVWTTAVG